MGGDATFGAMLRRCRRAARLSQEELAARAFVSTRAISDLERGVNARPRLHTAIALAGGLGLDGDERLAFERWARVDDEPITDGLTVPVRARPPLTVDAFVDDGSSLAGLLALARDPSVRLVTLIGPGGVGKTRLALEAAHRLDGPVAFVPLASLSDPDLLAATVGDVLGVEHGPTRTHLDSVVEHVGNHALTLVLDNLEQIVAAVEDVARLMRSCSGLSLVATSRVPLRVAGEVRFEVRPLDVGTGEPAQRPGVRLFLERARATGFATGPPDDVAAVAELCTRLDGLPLAIELAAARARIVAPAEMLRHLDRILDLLGTGRNDAPAHQQSMGAALEWSYRLLPPAAQEAFAALGVFATGASTSAAMTVWGLPSSSTPAFFDLVQTLADAHLIGAERAEIDGDVRIAMFETTRQFARQKLDASGGVLLAHRRLGEWALALVDRAEPALTGPAQRVWLDRLDVELPNLRAVGRWLGEQGGEDAAEAALRLGAGLARFWDIRSRWSEGVAWLSAALARRGGSAASRAKAHKALGVMHRCVGALDAAEVEQERAAALYGAAGDELGVASSLNNRGVIALDRSDYDRAGTMFRRALAACESHGDEGLEALVLNNLSLSTVESGALREAVRLCRRSQRLLAAHGNVAALAWVEDNLAAVLTTAGHPRWAEPMHHRAIRRRLEFGDESGFTWSLEALAAAWTATGETERAGRALGFVAAHRQRLGVVAVPHLTALTARRSAALVARVGAERFAELWDEGAELAPAQVRGWFPA